MNAVAFSTSSQVPWPSRATPINEVEASTAIYVDFEALGTKGARPSLLGVLWPRRPAGANFQQFVIDERVHPASVGRRETCVNSSIEHAVRLVVEEAEETGASVVSWSNYERDVVRSTCSTPLADRFGKVFRNALKTARPWKQCLYPQYEFVTERFGGSHPLKQYFRMIGYDMPARLQPSAPARWLKHVVQQMKAHDGRYSRVTRETKRDWRNLLEYNEHDCRGMRAVIGQAARELELWRAYLQTEFVVGTSDREVVFRVGSPSSRLDALLERRGVTRWAFLTAYNPESVPITGEVNDRQQRALMDIIRSRGYHLVEGEGRDAEKQWPAEPSVLVLGLGRREARELGRRFGQLAVVAGHRGFAPRLLPSGLRPDRHRRGSASTA
jgi:hypothetical protein